MKKISIISFFFSILITSCVGNHSEKDCPIIRVNLNDDIHEMDADSILCHDSVEVIPLQSDNCIPIGSVEIFKSDGQKNVIVDDERESVSIFNADGSFYQTIHAVGNANNEYYEIEDVCLNGNQIYILDIQKNKVFEYTINGKFVKSISIEKYWGNSIACKDGLIYLINDYSDSESGKYEIFVLDDNGTLVSKNLPFDGEYLAPPPVPCAQNLDEIMVVNHVNNTIYKVLGDECIPVVRLDFGDKQLPSECFSQNLHEIIKKGVNDKYILGIKSIRISKDLIFIDFDCGKKQYTTIYDRITEKSVTTEGFIVKSNYRMGLSNYYIYGDYVYEIVDASMLLFNYEAVYKDSEFIASPYKEHLDEMVKKMRSSDNPIIFKYKLR